MANNIHPLGSLENPIKCDGPQGERHYLSKLVTLNGRAIITSRQGHTLNSSEQIVDIYPIKNENGEIITVLYFDMYHKGYKEKKVPAPLKSINEFKKPQLFQKIDYLIRRKKIVYANKEEIEMPSKYAYLWSKAGILLARGAYIYAMDDFFGLPDEDINEQHLISLTEQIVHQLGGSHPSNPLVVDNQKTLSDLLKTFHYNKELPDNFHYNEVFRLQTYHVMDNEILELFVLINQM